jgi:hypothetical protein
MTATQRRVSPARCRALTTHLDCFRLRGGKSHDLVPDLAHRLNGADREGPHDEQRSPARRWARRAYPRQLALDDPTFAAILETANTVGIDAVSLAVARGISEASLEVPATVVRGQRTISRWCGIRDANPKE